MSHWAELDKNNVVIRVVVGDNDDPNGDEGYQWLVDNLGGTWVKTSYNGTIRKHFAGQNFTFDEARDAFIPPKLFDSWTLDEEKCIWVAPKPYPDAEEGEVYYWNEDDKKWELGD
jgi:hypothetical protein